jgi:hypothetical protein
VIFRNVEDVETITTASLHGFTPVLSHGVAIHIRLRRWGMETPATEERVERVAVGAESLRVISDMNRYDMTVLYDLLESTEVLQIPRATVPNSSSLLLLAPNELSPWILVEAPVPFNLYLSTPISVAPHHLAQLEQTSMIFK